MKRNTTKKTSNIGLTIYEIIARYYYEFKSIAERETKKFHNYNAPLDEDMFHNVILAMTETLGQSGYLLTVKQAKGYLCNSFKNALCRETLYARNKYRNDNFEECVFRTKDGNIDERVDYVTVIDDISRNFTKEECDVLRDFISGHKLSEINQKFSIKNADYIIRKIRSYVKDEYPEFNLKRKKKK